jgi:hypothetical protein
MSLTLIATLAQSIAVVFAVTFGMIQLRQFKAQKRREAMFTLVQSLQTKDMLNALMILDSLPEGLSKAELKEKLGDNFLYIQQLLGTWESLGILLHHNEVSLDIVDEFYSGNIVQSWQKLKRLVEDVRKETARDTRWEWFQWLSERMLEREKKTPPVPAYVAHSK